MALNLRKAVIRNGVVTGVLCLVLTLAVAMFTGSVKLDAVGLAWPLAVALGIGAFASWQTTSSIKKNVLNALPRHLSYAALTRGAPVNGVTIDWESIDDYAIQLETRGYTRLGEFTSVPLSPHFVGVAACFVDHNTSTLVEVQHIQMNQPPAEGQPNPGGVHISIMSALGGNITATTTDHEVTANQYLIRGKASAVASFPGLNLLQLLEKHTRLLAEMMQRTGKRPARGLNMHRYILLQRERFAQTRARIEAMSGYQIARQYDAFEAKPRSRWSTSSAYLTAMPERPLSELDTSPYANGPLTILRLDAESPTAS